MPNIAAMRTSETDKVFKNFLNRYFFRYFEHQRQTEQPMRPHIELYIRGYCPSNCEYCYLARYGSKLYPRDVQSDDNIIKNLKIFLNYYSEQNWSARFELFSGRMFDTDLGCRVLQTIYDHFDGDTPCKPSVISIPDDMQFLLDDKRTADVEYWINMLASKGIQVSFSASVDGKINDGHRFGERTDEFYEKLKYFIYKYSCGLHPMVSPENIHTWIENWDWMVNWDKDIALGAMTLEVRNNEWTESRLVDYLKFINHIANFRIKEYRNIDGSFDVEAFAYHCLFKEDEGKKIIQHGDCLRLPFPNGTNGNKGLTCSVQYGFCVRLGDLAIPVCHRTSYEGFIGGYFEVKDSKIVDIKSNNPEFYMSCMAVRNDNLPKCRECGLRYNCFMGCLGSNYESIGDPFWTPDSVCKLLHLKTFFILTKMYEVGALQWISENRPEMFKSIAHTVDYMSECTSQDKTGMMEAIRNVAKICV